MSQQQMWRVAFDARGGGQYRIFYGRAEAALQCAALHLRDGYFRLAPSTAWGSSVVLPPVFWSGGRLYQGARVQASWRVAGYKLLLEVAGRRAGLACRLQLCLYPPTVGQIVVRVHGSTSSEIELDARHGEAFKPVMLSSMHISLQLWDATGSVVGSRFAPIEGSVSRSRWLVEPTTERVTRLGLMGGCSQWKRDAPTVAIRLDRPLTVAGWRARNHNPNGDNLALWAASDVVLRSWAYTITATRHIPPLASGEEPL